MFMYDMKKNQCKSLVVGIICMVLFSGAYESKAQNTFQQPDSSFPTGALEAPLVIDDTEQYKKGTLHIGTEASNVSISPTEIIVGDGASSPTKGKMSVSGGKVLVSIPVHAPGGLCIGSTHCKTSWAEAGSSQWDIVPGGIGYTDGNVGIMTRSPSSTLSVVGPLDITSDNVAARKMYIGYNAAGNYAFISPFETSVGWKNLVINGGGGVVAVGTATTSVDSIPDVALNVGGAVNASELYKNGQPFDGSGSFPVTLPGGGNFDFVANENTSQPVQGWTGFNFSSSPNNSKRIIIGVDSGKSHNVFDIEDIQNWEHKMELRADGGAFFRRGVTFGDSQVISNGMKIGNKWAFASVTSTGERVIGYNSFFDDIAKKYKRNEAETASQIVFSSNGDIHFQVAGNGGAGSEISKWNEGLYLKNSINDVSVGINTTNPRGAFEVIGDGDVLLKSGTQAGSVNIGTNGLVDVKLAGNLVAKNMVTARRMVFSSDPNQDGDSEYRVTSVGGGVKVENNDAGYPAMYVKNSNGAGVGLMVDAEKANVGTAAFKVVGLNENSIGFQAENSDETRKMFFVPEIGSGGYNNLSKQGDAGIFYEKTNGFVIAPQNIALGEKGIRITPEGKVGIGMSDPDMELHVNGNMKISEKEVQQTTKTAWWYVPNIGKKTGARQLKCDKDPLDTNVWSFCPVDEYTEETGTEGEYGYSTYCSVFANKKCINTNYRGWQYKTKIAGADIIGGDIYASKVIANNVPGVDVWSGSINEGYTMAKIYSDGKFKMCLDESDGRTPNTGWCDNPSNYYLQKENVNKAKVCTLRTNDDRKGDGGCRLSKNGCFEVTKGGAWSTFNGDLGCEDGGADGGYTTVYVVYEE